MEKSTTAGKFERYIRSRGREEEGSHRRANNPGLGARYDMSQVIATYDNSNNWLQNFVWGERIDEILVLEQADVLDYDGDANTGELTRSYYHCNALGSVMEITDANQAAVVSYRYTPYGEVTITRSGVTQGVDPLGQYWGYTGRFSDEETALWYYRARYYNGATGRFLQRDPAGYLPAPSLYQYVMISPGTLVDPAGLDEESSALAPPKGAGRTYVWIEGKWVKIGRCDACHPVDPPQAPRPRDPEREEAENADAAAGVVVSVLEEIPGGSIVGNAVDEQFGGNQTKLLFKRIEEMGRQIRKLKRELEALKRKHAAGAIPAQNTAQPANVYLSEGDDRTDTNQDGVSDAVESAHARAGGRPAERRR